MLRLDKQGEYMAGLVVKREEKGKGDGFILTKISITNNWNFANKKN